MKLRQKQALLLLVAGDLVALYAALTCALILRYGTAWYTQFRSLHAAPFTFIFAVWIVVFYVAGLYDARRLRNNLDFFKTLALSLIINALFAVLFFYSFSSLGITPKTNLFTFLVIFALLEFFWRRHFNRATGVRAPAANIIVIGRSAASEELCEFLKANPQYGFRVTARLTSTTLPKKLSSAEAWRTLIAERGINLLVVPRSLKKESRTAKVFFELLTLGVEVLDTPTFYASIFRKVPLGEIDEEWFLENIPRRRRFYDDLKRGGEFLVALMLGVVLSPLELIIAAAVRLTSPGPAIYRQVRVGKNGREFTLYKFRTMRVDAEKNGPQWAQTNDRRSTSIGKVLRYSHLDEMPQLWNIIKGDLSFVGPRPERPEFVAPLKGQVAYYDIRHAINPGIAGWAQINHRSDQNITDVREKLQYDIYYLKNRSPIIDIAIVLKTLKTLFVTPR